MQASKRILRLLSSLTGILHRGCGTKMILAFHWADVLDADGVARSMAQGLRPRSTNGPSNGCKTLCRDGATREIQGAAAKLKD
ncbi:MAG: hypothetical protein EOO38_19645 [Cytophagaceae bacterium]|nr:MAG: hypothetical protein EOO38_19645 [Cytophagaceae bacterium]